MPLDPSIILQGQQPQIQSPLDQMSKAMAFSNLANQNQAQGIQLQQAQRSFGDDTAMRNAMDSNTSIDKNGSPTVDRAGVMSDLANTAPHLAVTAAQNFAQADATQSKQKFDTMKATNEAVGTLFGNSHNQNQYTDALAQMKGLGVDTSQFPAQFDPSFASSMAKRAMDIKTQFETNDRATSLGIQQQAADNKKAELGIQQQDLDLKRQQYGATKQQENFKDFMGHVESSRQLPDVKQAYTDRYAAQKLLDITQGDPNKLSSIMTQLAQAEGGKLATGGAPTEEVLKNLSPSDIELLSAKAKQFYSSTPSAANQGEFITGLRGYASTLQDGANKVIGDNMGKLGSSYQSKLSPSDYATFQKNFGSGSGSQSAQAQTNSNATTKQSVTQGATKTYNGTTYKVVGGHWVPQ